MSERHPPIDPPSEDESWEMRVEELARRLRYPPTPDIAGKVRVQLDRPHARRLPLLIRAAAVIGVTLLLAALLIPDLRSRALEFLQLGAVRFVEPAGTPVTTIAPPTSERAWVLSLPGETTLDAARQVAPFPLRLPTYPPDLGAPDRVFAPEGPVDTVVLVWLQPDDPGAVRFSLHALGPGNAALKISQAELTTVAGERAVWAAEPHEYLMSVGDGPPVLHTITAPVLIWQQDGITYRLEGDLTLDEARRIAESLE